MKDPSSTHPELIKEISALKQRIKELEATTISEDEALDIINAVHEPLINLDQDLRVVKASRSFYEFFKVKPEDTVGQLIYDLGNKQWDIPKLRELLETILPQKATLDNYEVEHDFATIGKRIMLLNARQIQRVSGKERIILLAIKDITERKELEQQLHLAIEDITELKKLEQQLHTMSLTDELTGLYNRRGFSTLAQQQLKITDRTKKDMLLFFADLDKMKHINDTLGHQEGDKALVEIATILKEVFRESDIIGRIGGDELAVLAIDTTDETREVLTNRLHNYLDDYNRPEGRNYTLSLSIGIAHYDPEKPSTLDELMTKADRLMYEEKRNKQH
ncbi:MAG: diguanylate cyclase [Proteobacteria bacterium]|nr:diguanylate cyclase [Pseudomonadota bacterium]